MDAAIAALERAVELDERPMPPRLRLASLLSARRRYADAERLLVGLQAKGGTDAVRLLVDVYLAQGKAKEAEPLVRSLSRNEPMPLLEGKVAEAQGKHQEAIAIYRKAMEAAPDNEGPRAALAAVLLRTRQLEQASKVVLEGLSKQPASGLLLLRKGEILLAAGEAGALGAFDAALRAGADKREALLGKGRALEARGEIDAAAKAYGEVLRLDPAEPDAKLRLAWLGAGKGDKAAALATLEEVKELAPGRPEPLWMLASVQIDLGRTKEARANVEASLQLAPSADAYNQLSRLELAEGDPRQALRWAKKAIELEGADPAILAQLAASLRATGSAAEALDTYQRILEKAPDDLNALVEISRLRGELGQAREAAAALEKALAKSGASPELSEALGDAYMRAGRWANAAKAYESVLQRQGVPYKLARVYLEQGKNRQALPLLEQAVQEPIKEPLAFRYLGFVYKELGKSKESRAAFRSYLESRPDAKDRNEIEDEIATLP
jgi:tetratricopeptide (TPR) repeat protein